jgi:hypothetical protein
MQFRISARISGSTYIGNQAAAADIPSTTFIVKIIDEETAGACSANTPTPSAERYE